MDNEYGAMPDYISEDYSEEAQILADEQFDEHVTEEAIDGSNSGGEAVPVQPAQVITQPVYTQPVIAQPIYTQPIYTQPIIMQNVDPAAQRMYPVYPVQNFLPVEEIKADRWHAPPVLVFFALLLCFPIGLVLLLFFTKWGVFPKIFLTLFTLICIWFAYEIVAFYTSFGLPSLLNSILG